MRFTCLPPPSLTPYSGSIRVKNPPLLTEMMAFFGHFSRNHAFFCCLRSKREFSQIGGSELPRNPPYSAKNRHTIQNLEVWGIRGVLKIRKLAFGYDQAYFLKILILVIELFYDLQKGLKIPYGSIEILFCQEKPILKVACVNPLSSHFSVAEIPHTIFKKLPNLTHHRKTPNF